MRRHSKSGGLSKIHSTVDTNTPRTSVPNRASSDQSEKKPTGIPSSDHNPHMHPNMIPRRHPMFPMGVPHGPQGPLGPRGPQGLQGPQGPLGPHSPQGPQGSHGPRSSQGPLGPQGPRGPQGLQGPQGPLGPHNPQGPLGPQSPGGPQGLQGPQGPLGPHRPQGPPGPQGSHGPQGSPGPHAPYGPLGLQGPRGLQGFHGPQRLMHPYSRFMHRSHSPTNFMPRDRKPGMMSARALFHESGSPMGLPSPSGFMVPMPGRSKGHDDMQRNFIKPISDGERKISGFSQRQDDISKNQGDLQRGMRKHSMPGEVKQEGFRQMGMPHMAMNKSYSQQGRPMGRFPYAFGRNIMNMPPSYRRMMRFPEKYMDLSNYSMDLKGRFVNQKGKHVNPLNRLHQGRGPMPASSPIKRRFMQRPELFMDMSRYTMDFEGHYRDNYGRLIDPMEQFSNNFRRYTRHFPPSYRRFARFPERYMDLSRYTMDFEGRFLDHQGRHVDPLGRSQRNYAKMNVPLNQMRFIRHPEKYMDMSRYTMNFQGRFLDHRGRPVDLLSRQSRQPGHFVMPAHYMHSNMPMALRRFAGSSMKPDELENRLMNKYGGPGDQMCKMPEMGPKPNVLFERHPSPERRISIHEKATPMESNPAMMEKKMAEAQVSEELNRRHPSMEHRAEFQNGPHSENLSQVPPRDDRHHPFPYMEDETMHESFMGPPFFPSMPADMYPPMGPGGNPYMCSTMPDDCFYMPPPPPSPMTLGNQEMYMPNQKPFADTMMMMMMMDMNTGSPDYMTMGGTPFMDHSSEYMMNGKGPHMDWCDGMNDDMHFNFTRMPGPMGTDMMHKRRMANETSEQSPHQAVDEDRPNDTCHEDQRTRFDDKHSRTMDDKDFDPYHDSHREHFGHHEDMDYSDFIPEMHHRFFNDDGYMFDGGFYPDYYGDEFYRSSMLHPFMNEFQSYPEYMEMSPGYMDELYYYPRYMGGHFGRSFYDDEDEEEIERVVEAKEEERRQSIHKESLKHRSPSPIHRPIPSHSPRHASPGPDEGDIEAEVQRRISAPRIVITEEKAMVHEKQARYLEETAEMLRERGRILREEHDLFLQELEEAGPLSSPQVQAEAEAHATVVEEEVNATEAEAEAVERLARTARRLSNVEHHRVLSGSRHHSIDNQAMKRMEEH